LIDVDADDIYEDENDDVYLIDYNESNCKQYSIRTSQKAYK
jgi:hypothetical protein